MQQRDATLELRLNFGRAGSGERDAADSFVDVVTVLRLLSSERKCCEPQSANESPKGESCGLNGDSNVRLRSVFRSRCDVNARPI